MTVFFFFFFMCTSGNIKSVHDPFKYRLVCSIPPRGFLYRTTLHTHQIDYRRANAHPSSYLATNKALSFHHCSVLLCAEEKDMTEEDRQRQICEPFIIWLFR